MAISSYLQQLKFDPKFNESFISKYLTNIRLVILVILTIIITGIFSFFTISKRLNPEVKIPIVFISTILPGASPDDIESLITVPIEDEVAGVKGVTSMTSSSSENASTISLEFESSIDPDKAKQDVQAAVDNVTNLPDDTTTPKVIKLDFEDEPVWQFALTGNTDKATLMKVSENLKNELDDLAKIDRVVLSGWQEQEIQILIKPEIIQEHKINPILLNQSIKTALASYPAGSLATGQSSYSITIDPTINSINDLRELNIILSGQTYKLGEIATINERSKPDQKNTYYADKETSGQIAVNFDIYKVSSTDIDDAVAAARQVVDKTLKEYDGEFKLISLQDYAEEIDVQFSDLMNNFKSTILLVFFTLLIFLGIRQALIASFSIPMTFLVSFTVMKATGLSLNFISMFSLLLGLGMLVDDAIVVIAAMTSYYRTGKFTATQTGLLVWHDFIIPIWTTTLTTVWAFLPLLLSTGILGEFIKSIPIVVSTTLLTSTAVAVLITIPLMMLVLNPNIPQRVKTAVRIGIAIALVGFFITVMPHNPLFPISLIVFILLIIFTYNFRKQLTQSLFKLLSNGNSQSKISHSKVKDILGQIIKVVDKGLVDFSIIKNLYHDILVKIISSKSARNKTIFTVVIFSIFSYLLVPLGFVVNEFFPKSDFDLIYAGLELPQGTISEITDTQAQTIIKDLRNIPEAKYVLADIGRGAPSQTGGSSTGTNLARFTIVLPKEKDRDKSSLEISQELRNKYIDYNFGEFNVVELQGGPPAGADIQIKLLGPDLKQLDSYADNVIQYLKTQEGLNNINKSVKQGTSKISFIPNQQKMNDAGVTIDQIGLWLRTFASGLTFDDIKINDENIDINFRMSDQNQNPESLGNLEIITPKGSMPLLSLGELTLNPSPTVINREDQSRTLSVTAGVEKGFIISDINKQLENYADTQLNLKPGYTWKTGGVNEENQKSIQSIIQAMGLSVILILITMVVQLGSFRKALIVILVIPLAISGVFVIFALTGTPLSFPALIGVLALFGIVVNNSIVVVERINQNLHSKISFKTAIIDGASGRIEPIVFSSITTIIGLIPITLSDPMWRGLGGAIIAGLTFSGLIMLFFIPVVYYSWYHKELE